MVKNAGNPQAMLQSMAERNPQLKQVMALVSDAGGDPQKAFYALAQQKGVDPEQVLAMLRS